MAKSKSISYIEDSASRGKNSAAGKKRESRGEASARDVSTEPADEAEETANQIAVANSKGGRGNKAAYSHDFADRAKLLCAKGATTHDLANHFGVLVSTILEWRALHNDFDIACKVDPDVWTARIEESLAACAIGYEHMVEEVRTVRGKIEKVRYRKYVPADVNAAKYWIELRGSKLAKPAGITPEEAASAALKRLYDAISGNKIMPNDDQQPYLDSQARAAEEGIPFDAYDEPEEDDAD